MIRTDVVVNEEQLETKVKTIFESQVSKSQKMKEMFDLGLDVKVIAEIMDVRYNFVYNVISNYVNIHDIPVSKSVGESKKDVIIQLFLAGKTNKEIAKELKLNYNYIYKVIREFGEQSAKITRNAVEGTKEVVKNEVVTGDTTNTSITDPVHIPTADSDATKSEQAASSEVSDPEDFTEIRELRRSRPPVEQTLWKTPQPETKSGIAAFFASRRKA